MKRRVRRQKDTTLAVVNCENKLFFESEEIAVSEADRRMLERPSVELGTYQCTICRLWHLTQVNKLVN